MKRHSDACERNREPILHVLKQWFRLPGQVLEIGAGTGQHAVYFAERLPHLTWLASDREENLDSIRAWTLEALPYCSPKYGSMASRTSGRTGVVAVWSR